MPAPQTVKQLGTLLPHNFKRATRARRALLAYAAAQGVDMKVEGADTVLRDLIADLEHLCEAWGIDFDDQIRIGRSHYRVER